MYFFTCVLHSRGLMISVQARNESAQTQQQRQSHGQGSSTKPPVPAVNTATRPVHSWIHRLLTHLVLFLCCAPPQHIDDNAQPTQQQEGQSQGQVQAQGSSPQTQPAAPSTSATPTSSSRPDGLISRLFSLFRSQRHTHEDIPHVVGVAAMVDKEALFVAGQPQLDSSDPQSAGTATPPAHSLPVRLLQSTTDTAAGRSITRSTADPRDIVTNPAAASPNARSRPGTGAIIADSACRLLDVRDTYF
ncbi:hypothetical protein F4604DRAFT_1258651 [Suillus subluteus]|nr:hypothetical protein F4604DRAFT_1258651 [Suillus subluteus]